MGASVFSEEPMSVMGAIPLRARSIPFTCRRTGVPGLKPSLRLKSVGSMGTPALFFGMSATGKSIRRPVGVDGSCLVK